MKKAIFYGALIALVSFGSCSKEDLFEEEKKRKNGISAPATLFQNPFEEVGKVHNNALKYVVDHPEFTAPADAKFVYHTVNDYLIANGHEPMNNTSMIEAIAAAPDILIDTTGEVSTIKTSFWDYIYKNFPTEEYNILREYYDSLSLISDIEKRKAVSLEYEEYVYNSDKFYPESKDRILRAFVVFRYSSSFWYNHPLKIGVSEAMGMFYEYIAIRYDPEAPCAGSCAGMAASISARAPGNGSDPTGGG